MADAVNGFVHRPVLYQEIIHALRPARGGFYLDGTLGAGGHAWGILDASRPDGRLLGLDVDPQALELARGRLAEFGERAILRRASYVDLRARLAEAGWQQVNGIVLDLGVSSMQLDTGERGFSFLVDAPLDMRFDPANPVSAADLVNTLPARELANILFQYGEEAQANRIVQAIVQARPVNTTRELAELVAKVSGQKRNRGNQGRHIHPATRTFQALRIAVNRELQSLEMVLPIAVGALAPGGRLAVISFHSLEDRLVKQFFRRESKNCLCPPRQPVCTCGHTATIIEITRRPIAPGSAEVESNPRSRSARLRIAERLESETRTGGALPA